MNLRRSTRRGAPSLVLSALAVVCALAMPAAAPAATTTYAGGIAGVSGTTVSFDVVSERVRGEVARTVTSVRTEGLPGYCAGGQQIPLDPSFRPKARIARDARFSATVFRTRDDFDSVSFIRGEVRGANASGRISFSGENPLFDSCSTGVLRFYADRVRPQR